MRPSSKGSSRGDEARGKMAGPGGEAAASSAALKRKRRRKRADDQPPKSARDGPKPARPAACSSAESAELDDIFATRPAMVPARAEATATSAATDAPRGSAKRRKKGGGGTHADPVFGEEYDLDAAIDPQNARVHRYDSASGLRVFKAHALGLGRGGGTPLCPFDCKCCF